MRNIKRTALLAMSVALSLAGLSYAQVMEKIPADALAVVKVSNLSGTSGKIAKLAETLGVNAFVPELNDPLGAVKKQIKDELKFKDGAPDGIKDDGELAFAYIDPKGGEPDRSMMILVPVSDYKALIGGIEGAVAEGNITVVNKTSAVPTYIADWNGYAAISPNKALIEAAPSATLKLPARAQKELTSQDIVLYGNIASLREPLTAELEKNREKTRGEVIEDLKAAGQVEEKYHPAFEALVDQGFNILTSFLRDTDAATVGLSITENGVKETIISEFKQDSYLGKLTAGMKNVDSTLLTGLPTGKYMAFGGYTVPADQLNQLIDDVSGPIVAKLPTDDETLKLVPEFLTDIKGMIKNIKSQSMGMVAPQGGMGQEALFQIISTTQGDPKLMFADIQTFTDKYSAVTNELMGKAQGIEFKQSWTPNAKTIDGLSFGVMSTEIVGDSPAAQQQQQMMQLFYGSPKQEYYLADAGNQVLGYMGASEDTVKALIAAAKAGESPLAKVESVAAVTKELPKARIAEVYIGVDEIIGVALRAANQFGLVQGTINLPPDLQPVGVSVSSEGSVLEFTGYISNDLLQALVSAGLQGAALMQGGGGGGNNGGL